MASPPTGASTVASPASDGAARASTLGVTGAVWRVDGSPWLPPRAWLTRQPRLLIANRQTEFGQCLHPAFQSPGKIDLRMRRPPGDAKLAIDQRGAPIVDTHQTELPQQRVRSACPIVPGGCASSASRSATGVA